jgi:hypothetical protein
VEIGIRCVVGFIINNRGSEKAAPPFQSRNGSTRTLKEKAILKWTDYI